MGAPGDSFQARESLPQGGEPGRLGPGARGRARGPRVRGGGPGGRGSFVPEARWGRGPTRPSSAESVRHLTALMQFVFDADVVVFVDVCLINSRRFVTE